MAVSQDRKWRSKHEGIGIGIGIGIKPANAVWMRVNGLLLGSL